MFFQTTHHIINAASLPLLEHLFIAFAKLRKSSEHAKEGMVESANKTFTIGTHENKVACREVLAKFFDDTSNAHSSQCNVLGSNVGSLTDMLGLNPLVAGATLITAGSTKKKKEKTPVLLQQGELSGVTFAKSTVWTWKWIHRRQCKTRNQRSFDVAGKS